MVGTHPDPSRAAQERPPASSRERPGKHSSSLCVHSRSVCKAAKEPLGPGRRGGPRSSGRPQAQACPCSLGTHTRPGPTENTGDVSLSPRPVHCAAPSCPEHPPPGCPQAPWKPPVRGASFPPPAPLPTQMEFPGPGHPQGALLRGAAAEHRPGVLKGGEGPAGFSDSLRCVQSRPPGQRGAEGGEEEATRTRILAFPKARGHPTAGILLDRDVPFPVGTSGLSPR